MVSNETRQEIERSLGQVPSFVDALAEPASGHGWGLFRDLNLGEDTELSGREKALIGVGVAAAINCPYCTYFHTEEARLNGVGEEEVKEAVSLGGDTRFFSSILHGSGTDLAEFKTETDEIVTYIEDNQVMADD